jgi:CBS-domain-containing membrane protein
MKTVGLLTKLRSNRAALPPRLPARHILLSWLGGFIAISCVGILAANVHLPLMLGSFGASCVLVFGFPNVPFSQPRKVIAGHVFSSTIGLVFLSLFGQHWWSLGLAVGTAIAIMQSTRTVHPPAGSNPVIIFLLAPGWSFLITPTLLGAVMIVCVGLIFNNLAREGRYPDYWL